MEKEENKEKWGLFYWLCLVVFILWVIFLLVAYWHFKDGNSGEKYGNTFNALNALFSGFAFAGIIFTILLQKRELALQREELKATRGEFQIQNETLKKQRFENTFFQLLRLHHEIVNTLGEKVKGRECIELMFSKFQNEYFGTPLLTNGNERDKINRAYLNFYKQFQRIIGHYLGNLYNILRFINDSDIEDKSFYAHLLRDQLSAYELLLLFYNSLSEVGQEKFSPIERFGLMKNLPKNRLINQDHLQLYSESAYQ